jgi:hypothetical protein
LSSIHFLQSSFTLFLKLEFYKSISFWCSCYWIYNNFCFENWRIILFKSLKQKLIIYCRIKITYINLISSFCNCTNWGLRNNLLRLSLPLYWEICCTYRLDSSNSTSMRCPVEFKKSIFISRNSLPIQSVKYVSGCLMICKFDKTITNRISFLFISYKFYACYNCNIIELISNILFTHPCFNIPNPKWFTLTRIEILAWSICW